MFGFKYIYRLINYDTIFLSTENNIELNYLSRLNLKREGRGNLLAAGKKEIAALIHLVYLLILFPLKLTDLISELFLLRKEDFSWTSFHPKPVLLLW